MEALSIQQLLDCSWGYNNNGCRGGWSWRAFQFVKDHGLATTKSYGKYLGQVNYNLVFIHNFSSVKYITIFEYYILLNRLKTSFLNVLHFRRKVFVIVEGKIIVKQ